MGESIQDKEALIIGTIISCNNEITKFNESYIHDTDLSEKSNMYHYNMLSLFSKITATEFHNLNESEIFTNGSHIKNPRKNYYSYFQKVQKFLSGFENVIQTSLNESLNVDENLSDTTLQLNITTFKNDLNKIIAEIKTNNDLDTTALLNPIILRTKIFARKPICILGFDICNNLSLRKELYEKYNIVDDNIKSIIFNKSTNDLLFVCPKTNNNEISLNDIIVYSLEIDDILLYTERYPEDAHTNKVKNNNMMITCIGELTGYNDLLEIYTNVNSFELKFVDNLYKDNANMKLSMEARANKPTLIKN